MSILQKGVLICLLLIACTSGNALSENGWLKMGVVPYTGPREVVKLYTPVARRLSQRLGIPVRVVTAGDYEQYMERVYAHEYDIIVLGSTFYFKAHDRAGYQAVARGYPSFYCGIIVRADSDIRGLDQLRGKSLAAVNSRDRGGFRMQKRALLKQGIDVETELDVHFRGKHDAVVYAVISGQDDAGAVRLDVLEKEPFQAMKKDIRIVYTSPENPQFPFAVHKGMDPVLMNGITKTLVSITTQDKESAAILSRLHIQGFERVGNEDMERLRLRRLREERKTDSDS